jgi:hypothetical protein
MMLIVSADLIPTWTFPLASIREAVFAEKIAADVNCNSFSLT